MELIRQRKYARKYVVHVAWITDIQKWLYAERIGAY